jgi:D-methionine transport system substrate-binding protein
MSFRSVLIAATVLAAWSASAAAEVIKVGVTPGPHAQILEAVKPIAAKKGLDIQLIEFSDYVVPNAALDAGELQANSFQNQPYLDNQKADRGYKIESVGLTVNFPIGVYSKKHKSRSDIPNGGTISIPNDPTNRETFFSREAWREFSDYDLEGSRGAPGGAGGACRSHAFCCNFNIQRY